MASLAPGPPPRMSGRPARVVSLRGLALPGGSFPPFFARPLATITRVPPAPTGWNSAAGGDAADRRPAADGPDFPT